jgi:hypothetical protein
MPHGLRVTFAIGRRSPTQGWAPSALGVELPFWLAARTQWRRVLPLLRQYERLRHWCAPALLRVPGTDAMVLAERARLEATREALGRHDSVRVMSAQGHVRLGSPGCAKLIAPPHMGGNRGNGPGV